MSNQSGHYGNVGQKLIVKKKIIVQASGSLRKYGDQNVRICHTEVITAQEETMFEELQRDILTSR